MRVPDGPRRTAAVLTTRRRRREARAFRRRRLIGRRLDYLIAVSRLNRGREEDEQVGRFGGVVGEVVDLGVVRAVADIADEDGAYPMEVGQEPNVRTLQSDVGLVWRAVVLWMLLLAMLSIAVWLG